MIPNLEIVECKTVSIDWVLFFKYIGFGCVIAT